MSFSSFICLTFSASRNLSDVLCFKENFQAPTTFPMFFLFTQQFCVQVVTPWGENAYMNERL